MTESDVITQAKPQAGRSAAVAAATPGAAATAAAPNALQVPAGALYASPLAAGARLQEFEISAVIGQGGFGIVYLARDLSLQRSVAIKEYMPVHLAGRDAEQTVRPLMASQAEVFELGRRSFIAEARMLARFKHPGLVEVLRFWEQNGTAYMAMPYYDGATLTQYLARHPGVATEAWLTKTLKPLVDALGHMHEEDCFHRDVAPDNILILKDGSAVLLDLGAARRVIANDAQAMTVMLKPGYAPIEQYSDDPRFRQGPWTDIYAMAAVFFFAISGKAPPASASRVMRDSVSPLAGVRPQGFSDSFLLAIDKGLSLQPEDRPRSINEFRMLLFATPPAQATPLLSPARKAVALPSRNQEAAVDDPFAPPRAGPVTPVGVAIGAAVLLLILAGAWLSIPVATTPADVAATSTLPAVVAPPAPSSPAAAVAPVAAAPAAAEAPVARTVPVTPTTPGASNVPPAPPAATPVSVSAASTAGAVAPPVTAPSVQPPSKTATPEPVPRAPAKPAATPEAESKAAVTATGTVVLSVTPWAEVRVNGVMKGISPPMKQLTLPAGRHTIEFRNPATAPVKQQIEVRANQKTVISQQF